jgi:hypothetical protein
MVWMDPTGENPFLLAAAIGLVIGVLFDNAGQLYDDGGRFECINWWQVGLSGGIGAMTGGAIGGTFRYFGVVANNGMATYRPTYSLGRKNPLLKRLCLRFESHPRKDWLASWVSYPHWHYRNLPRWWPWNHKSLVEPLAAITTYFTPDLGCWYDNESE